GGGAGRGAGPAGAVGTRGVVPGTSPPKTTPPTAGGTSTTPPTSTSGALWPARPAGPAGSGSSSADTPGHWGRPYARPARPGALRNVLDLSAAGPLVRLSCVEGRDVRCAGRRWPAD